MRKRLAVKILRAMPMGRHRISTVVTAFERAYGTYARTVNKEDEMNRSEATGKCLGCGEKADVYSSCVMEQEMSVRLDMLNTVEGAVYGWLDGKPPHESLWGMFRRLEAAVRAKGTK